MLKERGIILHPLSVTTTLGVTGFQKPLFRHNASRLTMAKGQRYCANKIVICFLGESYMCTSIEPFRKVDYTKNNNPNCL